MESIELHADLEISDDEDEEAVRLLDVPHTNDGASASGETASVANVLCQLQLQQQQFQQLMSSVANMQQELVSLKNTNW